MGSLAASPGWMRAALLALQHQARYFPSDDPCLAPHRATAATWTWGSAAAARRPAGKECHCHPTAPAAPRTPRSPTPPVGAWRDMGG